MLNKVILIGRLGHSPELRQSQSGKLVCTFTMATDTGYGENRKTEWHRVTVFDKAADKCAKYLHKGSSVYVEGRLSYDTYEKDGIKRTAVKIIANDVRFIGAKSDNPESAPQPDDGYQLPMSDDTFDGDPINDEVPF